MGSTWSTPPRPNTGDVWTAANVGTIADDLDYLHAGRPIFRVESVGTQTFASSGTLATVTNMVVIEDSEAGWDPTNHDYQVQTVGLWLITGYLTWSIVPSGDWPAWMGASLNLPGGAFLTDWRVIPASAGYAAASLAVPVSTLWRFGPGEKVSLQGAQYNINTVSTTALGFSGCNLSGVWLSA